MISVWERADCVPLGRLLHERSDYRAELRSEDREPPHFPSGSAVQVGVIAERDASASLFRHIAPTFEFEASKVVLADRVLSPNTAVNPQRASPTVHSAGVQPSCRVTAERKLSQSDVQASSTPRRIWTREMLAPPARLPRREAAIEKRSLENPERPRETSRLTPPEALQPLGAEAKKLQFCVLDTASMFEDFAYQSGGERGLASPHLMSPRIQLRMEMWPAKMTDSEMGH